MLDREKVIKDNAIRGLQNAIEISGAMVHLRKEHAKAILALLKEQEADMIALKNAYKELAEKGSVIVRCKECKHFYKDDFGLPICMEHKKLWIKDNWFCADGVKKDV